MARIRTIKPSFWQSETIAQLSRDARLTFIGLWNYVDDEGRAIANARLVKAAVWPLDDDMTADLVEGLLNEIADLGLITLYEVEGKRYLEVCSWAEHQRVSHSQPSTFPAIPEPSGNIPERSGNFPERSGAAPEHSGLNGIEGNRTEWKGTIAPRKRDALFESVAEVCGIDWDELTPTARGALNKAVAALRGVKASPDEVRRRAANWPYEVALTPPGLAKHWPALGTNRATVKPNAALVLAAQLEADGR